MNSRANAPKRACAAEAISAEDSASTVFVVVATAFLVVAAIVVVELFLGLVLQIRRT